MLNVISFGKRYLLACFVYVGLGLIIGGTIPTEPVLATAENPCSDGQQDCHGTCISSSEICCDDGTHGASNKCGCMSCSGGALTVICGD